MVAKKPKRSHKKKEKAKTREEREFKTLREGFQSCGGGWRVVRRPASY